MMKMMNRQLAFTPQGTSSVSLAGPPPVTAPMYYQPQYMPPQYAQPMGQLGDLSGNIAPFVFGMIAWAFFGDTIKGALGLGQAAASKGIAAAHKKLG